MIEPGHRVVLAEFIGGQPFSAVTANEAGRYRHYDFSWCRRDNRLLYHCSSNSLYLEHGDKPYWVSGELADVVRGGKRLKGMPVGWSAETLFDGHECEAIYCSICNDHLPWSDDGVCAHIHWCEQCGWWSGEGYEDNCDH